MNRKCSLLHINPSSRQPSIYHTLSYVLNILLHLSLIMVSFSMLKNILYNNYNIFSSAILFYWIWYKYWGVVATVTRNMFGLRSLAFSRVRLCCDDVIVLTKREPKFVIGYRLVSRWWIVKSNESFVTYWLKRDGMIVRIPVYLSSLLLAPTSKFYFANIWITPYILRNVDNWTRRKLKTFFWLRSRFRAAVLFLVKNNDVRNKF